MPVVFYIFFAGEERAFGKLLPLLENSPKCEEVPSDVVAELPLLCPPSSIQPQMPRPATPADAGRRPL